MNCRHESVRPSAADSCSHGAADIVISSKNSTVGTWNERSRYRRSFKEKETPDRGGHGSPKASLFLPEVREEAMIEEVPPGRPVVTGFTDTEVLIFDSVLV